MIGNKVYFVIKCIHHLNLYLKVYFSVRYFFFIYINEIVNSSSESKLLIFADDTTWLINDKNLNALHVKVTSELNHVKRWIQANRLRLNSSKTNYTLFQNRSRKYSIPPVLVDGIVIKQASHTKFLGVIIDENFN